MRNKKRFLLLLSFLLLAGMLCFTGCAKESGSSGDAAETKTQDYRVTLFYANEDYIANGDESLEKFMVYKDQIKATSDQIYAKTLEKLKTPPEEGYSTLITENIKFNRVYLDGDTAYVDLASEGLNGGSLEETFLISQIVDTLLQSFDEIKQVQFLVDGKPAESLMGHFDAANPFTKDLFTE